MIKKEIYCFAFLLVIASRYDEAISYSEFNCTLRLPRCARNDRWIALIKINSNRTPTCHPEPCPSAGEGPSLNHKQISLQKTKFPHCVRDDRCIAPKKINSRFSPTCHPETCLSAGEGPSLNHKQFCLQKTKFPQTFAMTGG